MPRLSILAVAALFTAAFGSSAFAQSDPEHGWFADNNHGNLPPSLDVSTIAMVPNTRHQSYGLRGVPTSYDWYFGSVQHAHNTVPDNYTAFVGWGQVLWRPDWTLVNDQALEIKDHATLICRVINGANKWFRLPTRNLAGFSSKPDFSDNQPRDLQKDDIPLGIRVFWPQEYAFHFYPDRRENIGAIPRCGLLYVFRARAVQKNGVELHPAVTPSMLIGGGADYWPDFTAEYPTNRSVGIGQLRPVSSKWRWYGFTTAYWPALNALDRSGYQFSD